MPRTRTASTCPYAARFRELVNMSPAAIRAWSHDSLARCYSLKTTRARLPGLADLRAKPPAQWTAADCRRAKRVVSFNSRFLGMRAQHGCTPGIVIALRNWGHAPRGCSTPRTCKG